MHVSDWLIETLSLYCPCHLDKDSRALSVHMYNFTKHTVFSNMFVKG